MCGGTIVGNEVRLVHTKMRACLGVGEVEYVEVDRYSTDAAAHLEWVDAFIEEVPKQLRPCALLSTGRVPDAGIAGSVVAPGPEGGVCARC